MNDPSTPSPTATRVAVIVVNYRTPELAIDCLASLETERRLVPGLHVVMVDNDSPDDSMDRISAAVTDRGWGDWCTVVSSGRNGGFAFGNVAGLEHLRSLGPLPEFILLLNPDTVVEPAAVRTCLDFAAAHPKAGIVGCRLVDEHGSAFVSAFRFPGVLTEWLAGFSLGPLDRLFRHRLVSIPPAEEPHEADWVSGAFMLLRRQLVEDVGLLDPAYFLYFEEVDLCLRAHRAGWRCWHVPTARTVHFVSASTGLSAARETPRRRPAYWFRSRRLFLTRRCGRLCYLAADAGFSLGLLTRRLRRRLMGRRDDSPPAFLRDLWRHQLGRGGVD